MKRLAVAICLLAFLLRLAAFLALDRLHHPDVWESEVIATNLLAGRGFIYPFLGTVYHSYMEPLYPGLCAAIYALTGHSFLALGIAQAVLGAGLVALVFLAGRRVAHDRAALVAALLAAVHPGLVLYATKFHPFVLDSLLLMAVLTACLHVSTSHPWRSTLLLGGLVGLCVLSRATVLACLPVIAWWIWAHASGSRVARAGQLAGFALAAAVVVAPWVVRNHHVQHRLVLTRSGTGLVFWLGNNPHAFTGSAATSDGTALYELLPSDTRARLATLDEMGQQDLFHAEARRFIAERPGAFVVRWAQKLFYFWWQTPQAGRLYPASWFRLYQGFYLVILGLSLAGIAALRRQHETWLVLGVCLSIAVLQAAFYVEGRHRLAIEPMLLLFAGAAVWRLFERLLVAARVRHRGSVR